MGYSSILKVATPATDLSLLTIDELRAAAGAVDESKDADLQRLGSRVADRLTRICNVKADGATPPTFLKESLIETFRRERHGWNDEYYRRRPDLMLSRRPIVSITQVMEDGTVLVQDTDYEVLAGSGMLRRLRSDFPTFWCGAKITVTYDAGWTTPPSSLKNAAEELVRAYLYQNSRDPSLRQINVPGVIERQFWVGGSGDPDIPQNIMDMLGDFREPVVG